MCFAFSFTVLDEPIFLLHAWKSGLKKVTHTLFENFGPFLELRGHTLFSVTGVIGGSAQVIDFSDCTERMTIQFNAAEICFISALL